MKECKDRKIYDILTKRCIQTNTKIFKKRIELQKKGIEIHFIIDELKKLGLVSKNEAPRVNAPRVNAATQVNKIATQANKAATQVNKIATRAINTLATKKAKTSPKNKISENAKRIIINYIKRNKKNAMNKLLEKTTFKNIESKKFCGSKMKDMLLPNASIDKQLSITYTFYKLPTQSNDSMESVFEKIDKKGNVLGLNIITHSNNYDSRVKYNNHDDDGLMDATWFNELNEYIINLPPRDIIALFMYTSLSDVILNTYSRDHTKAIGEFRSLMHHFGDSSSLAFVYPLMEIFERYKARFERREDKREILSSLMKTNTNNFYSMNMNIDYMLTMNLSIDHFEELKVKDKIEFIENLKLFCFKFLKDDVIEELININIKIIDNIIDKAPPLRKKMLLYRGVSTDYHFDKKKPNIFFKTKAFVSTTIKKDVVFNFVNETTKCCVQEITVLPGTKMIWMEGLTYSVGEFEFLLSSNTTFLIRNHKKLNKYPKEESIYDICGTNRMSLNNSDTVYVSEVVAL